MTNKSILLSLLFVAYNVSAQERGFSLSDDTNRSYSANLSAKNDSEKTNAQRSVDHIKRLGGTHVVLLPKARMEGPFSNTIIDETPDDYKPKRLKNYVDLIKYIHSLGMTVGIRPVFFVYCRTSSGQLKFPCIQQTADGSKNVTWWHGNIQPSNPYLWFESFQNYIKTYLTIAKLGKVDEFTIGAELYSMTVGIEDQWLAYPHGFPCEWLKIYDIARAALPNARIMYDINFTDDAAMAGDSGSMGGELERWRYRIVDLAPKNPQLQGPLCEKTPTGEIDQESIWRAFVKLWSSLDQIGIDMYRSLATKNDIVPNNYESLILTLKKKTDQFAEQMNTTMIEIESITETHKQVIFKELGYKSKDRGFINSEEYDDPTNLPNMVHQAAAYEAYMRSFWVPGWDWYNGVMFWDISVNPLRQGPTDSGFTPLGKQMTEKIIQQYFYGR